MQFAGPLRPSRRHRDHAARSRFPGLCRDPGRKGEWRITTIKPAAYDSPIGQRTPHIHFTVHGAGGRLTTQMYFSDDEATNLKDGLYKNLGGEAARTVARLGAANRYNWDIVLKSG